MARLLIFGDSIAHGADDTNGGGWVQYLRSYFDNAILTDPSYDYSVYNQAVSGDTTEELLARFEHETKYRIVKGQKDAVLFSIGINDSVNLGSPDGNPRMSVEKFKQNLSELIKKARKYTNEIILVGITPVDEAKTNPIPWDPVFYTNKRIKLFEDAVSTIAKKNDLPFIPIFEEYSKKDYKKFLPDGLHPNTEGHKILFELIEKPLVKDILKF